MDFVGLLSRLKENLMEINWESIYKKDFISFKDCYLTCDGYCCKNFFGSGFKLLNQNAVVLPMLEGEYEYYKNQGGIYNISKEAKREEFSFGDKKLVLYYLSCECRGLCNPHCLRPLICRIYPYFPIVNIQGDILDFYPASLMDLFFGSIKNHQCTLVREYQEELKTQLNESLKEILCYPLFVFIFRLMEIVAKHLQESLQNQCIDSLNEKERAEFLRKLEWNLLSRKAWNNQRFKEKANGIYQEMVAYYGEFL